MPIDLRGTGAQGGYVQSPSKGDSRIAFKVQVGPAQIAIHQGQSVLLTEPDGQVNSPSNRGLYFRDTRVISGLGHEASQMPRSAQRRPIELCRVEDRGTLAARA
jgi:hypothetical protein